MLLFFKPKFRHETLTDEQRHLLTVCRNLGSLELSKLDSSHSRNYRLLTDAGLMRFDKKLSAYLVRDDGNKAPNSQWSDRHKP